MLTGLTSKALFFGFGESTNFKTFDIIINIYFLLEVMLLIVSLESQAVSWI